MQNVRILLVTVLSLAMSGCLTLPPDSDESPTPSASVHPSLDPTPTSVPTPTSAPTPTPTRAPTPTSAPTPTPTRAPTPTSAPTPTPTRAPTPTPTISAPTNLSYSAANYTVGVAITNNSPTWSGGSPTSFSVSPSLPSGLNLSLMSGIISGTPLETSSRVHTVTASNNGGSTNFALTITITGSTATPTPIPNPLGLIYYFSDSQGDDSRTAAQAQNSSTPWKSLAKLNSFQSQLQAGDAVYFKRGDTFYGSLNVSAIGTAAKPIKFNAYGSGPNPIISGFTTVPNGAAGWQSSGGNIWKTINPVTSLSTVNMVVMNGVNTPMGRYPNTGYLKYERGDGYSAIIDDDLPSSPNWTGAEIAVRLYRWVIDRNKITSHVGGKLSFVYNNNDYEPKDGYGYFIQNDLRTLDVENEWYFDPNSNSRKLHVYSAASPMNVRVSSVEYLVTVNGAKYIQFENLTLSGANDTAIKFTQNSPNVSIKNCIIEFSGRDAINAYPSRSESAAVENNVIQNSNNSGITLGSSSNVLIQNNTVENSGVFPGMGYPVNSSFEGVISNGDYGKVLSNIVRNSGYNGIRFEGQGVRIEGNLVDRYCFNKDDGGGIYVYPQNGEGQYTYVTRTIKDNIVLNGIGATEATDRPDHPEVSGIYLDGNSPNFLIENNTIAHALSFGIFINGGHTVEVRGNTIYNTSRAIFLIKLNQVVPEGISLFNNILVARTNDQYAAYFEPGGDLPTSFTANYNVYARPINDTTTLWRDPNGTNIYMTLAQWKTYSQEDANSTKSPHAINSLDDLRFEYNDTGVNKTINLGASYKDMRGVTYSGSITLAPGKSAVLIKNP